MKKWVNIVLAVMLSVLITVVSGPHEILHSFSHHEDTIDRVEVQHHGLEKRFEKAHIHCDYLGYTLSHYVYASTFHLLWITKLNNYDYVRTYFSVHSNSTIHYYLRGPPQDITTDGLI